jgi:hypothetical protein
MPFDCLVYFKHFCSQPVVSRALQFPFFLNQKSRPSGGISLSILSGHPAKRAF